MAYREEGGQVPAFGVRNRHPPVSEGRSRHERFCYAKVTAQA